MKYETDYVITELTIDLLTDNNNIGKASFIFIDQTPHFPKVQSYLDKIDDREDAYVHNYSISTTEIDETTDISQLDVIKH
tara:strand:- start:467 stop:706 length:240 start_codon:yes stop_codon:yes gene_type:complete